MIRGTRRGGINYNNRGGGPRNWIGIAGQSNAGQGPDPVADLPSEYKQLYNNILSYKYSADRTLNVGKLDYSDNTTYQDPVQTGVFAVQFFAASLTQIELGGDLYMVLYSQGDTSLSVEWKSTATVGSLYTSWINKMQQFKRGCFNADGVNPSLKFIIWDQGEKDGRIEADANAYETNLTNLINNVRTAIGEASVPFLLGKFNSDIAGAPVNPVTFWETINNAKDTVAGAMTNVISISMEDAEMDTDLIHYTPAGYLTRATNYINAAIANGYI